MWQPVHGFGTFSRSVVDGVMKRNVWLRTLTSAIVCSIAGMWHATHALLNATSSFLNVSSGSGTEKSGMKASGC